MSYQCPFCPKKYKIRLNYTNHVNVCEFLCKPLKEQEHDIEIESEKLPNPQQMFQLIKHLSTKISKLENDINTITQKNTKQFDVILWLNTKDKPPYDLHTMICNNIIPNVHLFLDVVLQNNLLHGFTHLFTDFINNNKHNVLPICSFSKNKTERFYIFKENHWKIMEDDELFKYFECICVEFVDAFNNNWYIPNQSSATNKDTFEEQYIYFYKKVLGDINKECLFKKIKSALKPLCKVKV